jgi:hypothetical protein
MINVQRLQRPLTDRQNDELQRVGRIPRQYDSARVIFQYDATTGTWRNWRETMQFLTSGQGEAFNVAGTGVGGLAGATFTKGEGDSSLDQGGFPSKELSFLVTGISFEFGLPYEPSSDNAADGTTNLAVAPFGALSITTQQLGEYLIRAALQGATVTYTARNCSYQLGPVQEMPSGVGINDPKGAPSSFGVQADQFSPDFRRDPIVLPPSDPKYAGDYFFTVTLNAGANTDAYPVPAALTPLLVPAANDIAAIPVRMFLRGIYGVVEGNNFFAADSAEEQILQAAVQVAA